MAIEVPWQQLSQDALEGVISSVIEREGTDYGEVEVSFEQKKQQIYLQLKAGELLVVFDEQEETCNIMTKQAFKDAQLKQSLMSAEEEYFGR